LRKNSRREQEKKGAMTPGFAGPPPFRDPDEGHRTAGGDASAPVASPRRRAMLGLLTATALPAPAVPAGTVAAGTALFADPTCAAHEPPPGHPDQSTRLTVVLDALAPLVAAGRLRIMTPATAGDADLELVHDPAYIALARAEAAAGADLLSTGDTPLSRRSIEAATAAAGCGLGAVDAVLTGRCRAAFCAVRPPGHHASVRTGMGFGIFNTIAIAARHAQKRHGVERILIVDWDVHHGNGTQATFWSDGRVLFFDTHQHPWYPGTGDASETGEGRGKGLIVNRPLPAGTTGDTVLNLYDETLRRAADRFRPQLVLVSAGFDSRIDDPLGRFRLTDADFDRMTERILDIADRHAGGRCVSILEGGYNLPGLASAARTHVERLCSA